MRRGRITFITYCRISAPCAASALTLKELRKTVTEHHAAIKDKLSHSELPALANNCSAILFASSEFNSLLMSLCHR